MKIQILGTGCPKCNELAENAKTAAKNSNLEYEMEKVTDIMQISKMGVMITPALAIDGKVVSSGKLLGVDEIAELLKK